MINSCLFYILIGSHFHNKVYSILFLKTLKPVQWGLCLLELNVEFFNVREFATRGTPFHAHVYHLSLKHAIRGEVQLWLWDHQSMYTYTACPLHLHNQTNSQIKEQFTSIIALSNSKNSRYGNHDQFLRLTEFYGQWCFVKEIFYLSLKK